MGSLLFQIMSLVLIVFLLGVPVIVTMLLLKHYGGNKRDNADSTDFLIRKISELEERVKELEDKLDFTDID